MPRCLRRENGSVRRRERTRKGKDALVEPFDLALDEVGWDEALLSNKRLDLGLLSVLLRELVGSVADRVLPEPGGDASGRADTAGKHRKGREGSISAAVPNSSGRCEMG